MASQTTSTSAVAWSPDLQFFTAGDVVPDALILQTSTVAGAVEGDRPSVRVPYVDDAEAGFVAEGADIDVAEPDLNEVVVYTGKVSQLVKLSREQYHQEGADGLLSESVARAVTKAANVAYLAQPAPTSPATTPPAGIAAITGVVPAAADVTGDLDVLVDLLATLQANGAQPSHILLSPTAWARLRKMKIGDDFNASLLGAGTEDAAQRLLGIPAIVTPALATGKGLVLDKTAIMSAVGDLAVATSEHFYFGSDNVALRCTWRFGQNLVKPNRIGTFNVA